MRRMNMKRLKILALALTFSVCVSTYAMMMEWECITIGGWGGGMTCRICTFYDENGNSVGGYTSCH